MGEFYKEEMFKQQEAAVQQRGLPTAVVILGVIAAVALLVVVVWWKITHNPDTMIVDINHASKTELAYLPGVGPVTAEAIIEHRPYKAPEDLKKVPGIGAKTFEKMKSRVKVE